MSEQLTLIEEAFGLTVVEGENLQLTLDGGNGPAGPAGAAGAAGPNTVTTSTSTTLTGYIFGNGTTIAGATAAASDATPSTLVRRNSNGDASFGALDTSGLTVTGGTTFGDASLIQFDAVEYYYGAGAASAHRTALGSGATGDALFTAATPAAARTTLELDAFSTNGSITGTGALTLASAAASNINLTPGTTGFVNLVKTSATGVRESILRAKVSDAGDDTFQIYNGTITDGRFSPAFGGAAFSNPGTFGLLFNAVTNAANDTGTTPMMLFAAGRTSSTSDPFNGTFADVITRPLFRWQTSGNNLIAEISAARNLSIFTTTASTSTTTGALVVAGGVGIAGAVNAGSLALTAPLPITSGGTGATTAGLARTALGSGATGDALFTAVSASAARTTLEMVPKLQVGTPTLAASWTDNGGGSYTNTAGATGDTLVLPWSGLTDGKTYLIRFTVTAYSGGGNMAAYLGAVNANDLFSGAFSAARSHVYLWVKRSGTANQITFRVNLTLTGSMTINDIRVVELPF